MSDQPPNQPTPPPSSGDGPPPWGGQPRPGPYYGQQPPTQPGQQGPYGQQPGPYGSQQPPTQPAPYQQPGVYAGQPGQPLPTYGPPPQGGTGKAKTKTKTKTKTAVVVAAVLAVVLVLAGGGAFAYAKLGGGGEQPAEALPGNAIAYWRMDIDPSVGQKVAAVRFVSKLPKSKGDFTTGDFRQKLWEAAQEDNPSIKDIDYDADIKPWLGDRMGMTVSAPARSGEDPAVAVAVQVKDEGKAREGIDKILAAAPQRLSTSSGASAPVPAASVDKPAYFFHGDYAVFTEPDQRDAVKSALEDGTLSENDTFTADMDDLGEQGIMSGWMDLHSLTEQVTAKLGPSAPAGLGEAGRLAVALRFDSDYLELAGITRGQKTVSKHQTDSAITTLPEDTAVAMSLSNGDELVGSAWDTFTKIANQQTQQQGSSQSPQQFIDDFQSRYGISLPGDLKTLVGSNLVLAAPDQDVENSSGPDDIVVGAKVPTDASKAEDVMGKLEKIARDQGSDLPIVHRADGDQFVASVSQPGLDWIAGDGKLGDSDAFRLAVPDADKAQFVTYVDFDKVEHHYLDQIDDSEVRDLVKSFRSFGLSARVTGDGEGEFSMRLVSN